MKRLAVRYAMVALLFMGSATLLFSCADSEAADNAAAEESLMTDYSENLSIVMSRNGRRSYFFTTPLVEGYSLARDPYKEFRKGVKITTFQDDSLTTVDAVLTANYAIFYQNRELWEAKGNVVIEKSDGKRLYTQQLFWNQRTKKIYSNVDTKVVQSGGRDNFIGEGFESDEEFKDWRFRRMKGRMEVDVSPTQTDSTALEKPAADSVSNAAETPATLATPASTRGGATPVVSPRPADGTPQPAVSPRLLPGADARRNRPRPVGEQPSTGEVPEGKIQPEKLQAAEQTPLSVKSDVKK